jgi:hypothetical protein
MKSGRVRDLAIDFFEATRMHRLLFTLCLSAFSFSSYSYADHDDSSLASIEELLDIITVTTPRGIKGITTSLENPHYREQDHFFSFSIGAWKPKIDGITNLLLFDVYAINPLCYRFSVRAPTFKWGVAAKGQWGCYFHHDGWACSLGYLYSHAKGKRSVTTQAPSIIIPFNEEGLSMTASSMQAAIDSNLPSFALSGVSLLNLVLNDAFLTLGRSFFLSPSLSLQLHFGVKSTWLRAQEHSNFSGGGILYDVLSTSDNQIHIGGLDRHQFSVNNHQKFYGIGPRIGIDTKWYLTKRLNLYVNALGALLFGYFTHALKETYSLYPSNLYLGIEKPKKIVPYQDIELGFGYSRDFNHLKQHLDLQIGYEVQDFVGGSLLGKAPSSLGFYGFNFNLRFSF